MPGCAAVLGAAGFLIGFVAAWLSDSKHLTPLESGVMTAALTFAAAWILAAIDRLKAASAIKQVRWRLLNRQSIDEKQFAAAFPDCDSTLPTLVRKTVAEFFDVPAATIHPDDHPRRDYQLDVLEGLFVMSVVFRVIEEATQGPGPLQFRSECLTSYPALIAEIQQIVDDANGRAVNGEPQSQSG